MAGTLALEEVFEARHGHVERVDDVEAETRRCVDDVRVVPDQTTLFVLSTAPPVIIISIDICAAHTRTSGAARGKGEASPLWVDVKKLCNMCVPSVL